MDKKTFACQSESELTLERAELCFKMNRQIPSLHQKAGVRGRMENPSGYGKVAGTCGKSLEIYLRIPNQVIEDARFLTNDRSSTQKCGSAVVELCIGLTPDEAARIGGDTILACLGGLPKGKVHCAFLAAEALHAALDDWERRLRYAGSQRGPQTKSAAEGGSRASEGQAVPLAKGDPFLSR